MDKVPLNPIIPPVQGETLQKTIYSVQGITVLFQRLYNYLALRLNAAITADGEDAMTGPLVMAPIATASLPAASAWTGGVVWDDTVDQLKFSNGSSWIALSAGLIGMQFFTAGGSPYTYTPTAGTNSIVVEVVGGGGGGGGCALTGAAQMASGQPGGGGGYTRKRITSGFSGVTITVGAGGAGGAAGNNAGAAGGTSSFGAICSATGGGAGAGGAAGAAPYSINVPSSGAGSGGDINLTAGGFYRVVNTSTANVVNSRGGCPPLQFSPGGGSRQTTTTTNGFSAGSIGGGGSGGLNAASQGAGASGGDGSGGIVIVWEFA